MNLPAIGILLIFAGVILWCLIDAMGKSKKKIFDETEILNERILQDRYTCDSTTIKSDWQAAVADQDAYDFTNVADIRAEYRLICEAHNAARCCFDAIEEQIVGEKGKITSLQKLISWLEERRSEAWENMNDKFARVSLFERSPEWEAWLDEHGDDESPENITNP